MLLFTHSLDDGHTHLKLNNSLTEELGSHTGLKVQKPRVEEPADSLSEGFILCSADGCPAAAYSHREGLTSPQIRFLTVTPGG